MALSILNNIPGLAAQNELSQTNLGLQRTLYRLSSGSRINSGADDAAGLAIADGLRANISALTQSARNTNDGVGHLQVADGALAQVTTLLNRAVTLATQASTGTVSDAQRTSLDAEFSAIKTEIDSIGANTTFNGAPVFSASAMAVYLSDGGAGTSTSISVTTGALTSLGIGLGANASNTLSAIANATATKVAVVGAKTYTFIAALTGAANEVLIGGSASATLANLAAAVNAGAGAGVAYGATTVANADVKAASVTASTITFTAKVAGVGGNAFATTTDDTNMGWSSGATLAGGSGAAGLTTSAAGQAALTTITAAVSTVAGLRGTIGAGVNQLHAASAVIGNQIQNLTAGEDGIRGANIPEEIANMARFNILTQTGIAALSQANSQQQAILALLR